MLLKRLKQLTRQPEIWSIVSTVLRNTGYIFLMPIVLRTVPSDQMGLWYVLMALGGFAALADLGFSQTIGRFASSLATGEGWIGKFGIANSFTPGALKTDLRSFTAAARSIHRLIAVTTVVVMIITALFTYFDAKHASSHTTESYLAFIVFLITTAYSAYSRWLSIVLTGLGEVTYVAKQTVKGTIAYLIITAIGLSLDGGLLALALGQCIQPFTTNFLLSKKLESILAKLPTTVNKSGVLEICSIIWPNAWRMGLVMLGSFLINNANTLIASRNLTLTETACYGLSVQFINLLTTVAYMVIQARIPEIVSLRVLGDLDNVQKVFGRQLILSVTGFIAGIVCIIFFAPLILIQIKSQTQILPFGALMFLAFYKLLEFHHGAFSSLVITENRVPFVVPALVSGFAIITLGLLLAPLYGVWGLMLSTAIVQASFNNWWSVWLGLKSVNCNYTNLIRSGLSGIAKAARMG
jgi:O-antigen/teichoic acid export membrane protein